jgi:hypothetical protein
MGKRKFQEVKTSKSIELVISLLDNRTSKDINNQKFADFTKITSDDKCQYYDIYYPPVIIVDDEKANSVECLSERNKFPIWCIHAINMENITNKIPMKYRKAFDHVFIGNKLHHVIVPMTELYNPSAVYMDLECAYDRETECVRDETPKNCIKLFLETTKRDFVTLAFTASFNRKIGLSNDEYCKKIHEEFLDDIDAYGWTIIDKNNDYCDHYAVKYIANSGKNWMIFVCVNIRKKD